MLTFEDLANAQTFLEKTYALKHYSREKNELSYSLCAMNAVQRSDTIEAMILGLYRKCGYNTYRLGGTKKNFDLFANEEKIEVKSSLAKECKTRKGTIYYTYSFSGIKPEYFDRLILAYVTPHELHLRILTKTAVYARIRKGCFTRGNQGYGLRHNKGDNMIGQKFSNFLQLTSR
jgi:hypothetical protein